MTEGESNPTLEERVAYLEHCLSVIAPVIAIYPERGVRGDLVRWIADSLQFTDDPPIDAAKYPHLKRFVDSM